MNAKRVIVAMLIAMAVGLGAVSSPLVVKVDAQGSAVDTSDCELLRTYPDGRQLFLCPPASSVAPTQSPTAAVQPTATEPADTSVPYPGAPLCPTHDPTAYHGLWDPVRGCHYDHFHGDDPHSVDDIFGTQFYQWAGGEISYPWQTVSPSGCLEDDCKHTGYIWLVRRDLPCTSQYADGCIVAFRALIHGMSSSNASSVRYHSAWLEAKVCRIDNPDICGIFRSGGWQDSGDLLVDGNTVIDVPNNFTRFKLHYANTGNIRFGTWYSGSPGGKEQRGGMWGVVVGMGDLWGPVDPQDPTRLQFFCQDPNLNCDHNGSRYQPHVVSVQFPPRLLAIVDPDHTGVANYEGYADRYGKPVQGCTSVSLDCVPLIIQGVPDDIQYQGRFDFREYDVLFDRQTSGWIKFPNP